MKKALFSGTFDPPTLGHLDILQRAANGCEKLYVGIGENSNKQCKFSLEEREKMLEVITNGMVNVEIVIFSGLVVDFAKSKEIDFIVRGLRTSSDFDIEYCMAHTNRLIGNVDTFFLMADGKYSHISSSLIREIAHFGRRLHGLVPPEIEALVFDKLRKDL